MQTLFYRQAFLAFVAFICLGLLQQTIHVSRRAHSSNTYVKRTSQGDTVIQSPYHNVTTTAFPSLVPDAQGSLAGRGYIPKSTKIFTWESAVNKGLELLCACKGKWSEKLDSKVTQADLDKYYTRRDYESSSGLPTSGPALREALESLGLPYELTSNGGKDGKLQGFIYEQDSDWVEDGISFDPTFGEYMNVMSPASGLIIAERNFGCAYETRNMKQPYQPPVNRWSDIAYLNYASIATVSQLQGLEYVVRTHTVNANTNEAIEKACGGPPPTWPGMTFPISNAKSKGAYKNEKGLALLGTPNGSGVGYLLMNHKNQLGVTKRPISVTVWKTVGEDMGGDDGWYHMLFELR